uniref:Small ribosomal subunit protein uS7 domain-containing protein n=1 Tax=Gorilla gorilla gorilla TaxID=9595 RepID=G3RXS5_GORGO
MTEWETAPAVVETPDTKLFGKWTTNDDVQISDISLQDSIAVKEKYAKYLPHNAGPYAAKRFCKAQCPIVESLTNSMIMHGHNNSKKLMTVRIIKYAFHFIHLLTGENPHLQVLVNTIINGGPQEDSTGTLEGALWEIMTIAECLADELITATKGSSNSFAIKKKDELACVAKSNR